MSHAQIIQAIRLCGIVPAVRAATPDDALRMVEAIAEGGIVTLEIPLTVPGALALIGQLRMRLPNLVIGAGTVLDAESANAAIASGAQFIVSPALNPDTITYSRRHSVPVLPGALTPTEILNAWQAGADIIKVFPASAMGGARYLRALSAPFPHIALMPMGGVTIDTAASYLAAGAVALGVGTDLADISALHRNEISSITKRAADYVLAVKTSRGNATTTEGTTL